MKGSLLTDEPGKLLIGSLAIGVIFLFVVIHYREDILPFFSLIPSNFTTIEDTKGHSYVRVGFDPWKEEYRTTTGWQAFSGVVDVNGKNVDSGLLREAVREYWFGTSRNQGPIAFAQGSLVMDDTPAFTRDELSSPGSLTGRYELSTGRVAGTFVLRADNTLTVSQTSGVSISSAEQAEAKRIMTAYRDALLTQPLSYNGVSYCALYTTYGAAGYVVIDLARPTEERTCVAP